MPVPSLNTPLAPTSTRRGLHRIAMPSLLLTALLAGCGGGGGGDAVTIGGGVGSGGTGSFTVGSVSGFGSIIVNGNVRLDDSTASFRTADDDGSDEEKGLLGSDDVKLGMIVEVEGGSLSAPAAGQTLSTGKAQVIRLTHEIKGPVANIDATAGTFTLLGQTVKVNATTVYENVANLSAANGSTCPFAEVYAYLDASNFTYNASRVECKTTQPQSYRLFGPARLVTGASLNINSFQVNFGPAVVPAGLANGDRVRVRINPASLMGNVGTASRISKAGLPSAALSRSEAEIKGLVTDFVSSTNFKVNGISVTSTGNTVFEGAVGNGLLVEVKGSLSNGVLTAVKVEIESDDDQDAFELELIGTIGNVTADTFTLTAGSRNFTVSYGNGTEGANLVTNGLQVEVKGTAGAAPLTLTATRIEIED